MRLIDTDALIETIKEISHYDDHDVLVVDWDDMMIRIDMDEALTIDAEPVVRCKNCKFNYANQIPSDDVCQLCVELPISKDFFCAYGAKMDEVNE